jgi:hypothetical protein
MVKLLCDKYFSSVVFFSCQFPIVMNGDGGVGVAGSPARGGRARAFRAPAATCPFFVFLENPLVPVGITNRD